MEGPSTLQVGKDVILYFDAYTKGHYAALASTDLKAWRDVTKELVKACFTLIPPSPILAIGRNDFLCLHSKVCVRVFRNWPNTGF